MFLISTRTTVTTYEVAGIWTGCQLHRRPQVALFDYYEYVTVP